MVVSMKCDGGVRLIIEVGAMYRKELTLGPS